MKNNKLLFAQITEVGIELAEERNLNYWSYEIIKNEHKNECEVWFKCYEINNDEAQENDYVYIVRSYSEVEKIFKILERQ